MAGKRTGGEGGGISRFLEELKRRNVVRVGAVYAAVGFAVIEVVQAVFPALLFPDWLERAVVVLVLLGFPIALVIAWAFEVTPSGIRRTEDLEPAAAEDAGTAGGGAPAQGAVAGGGRQQSWLPLPVAMVVGTMLLIGVGVWWFGGRAPGSADGSSSPPARGAGRSAAAAASGAPLVQLSIPLPPGDSLVPGRGSSVAISPDGSRIVYVAVRRDTSRLYLRPLDAEEAEPIPGTEGARAPFFSPDGRWVAFNVDYEVRKVSLGGGAPLDVADGFAAGGSWGRDDTLTLGRYGSGRHRGLYRVPADGGEPRPVTTVAGFARETPEQGHVWPEALPGGRKILYASWNLPGELRVAVHDLDAGESRWLLDPGTSPRYVGGGRLVYAWAGNVLAVEFDPEAGEVRGSPVPVLEGVAVNRSRGSAHFDVSRTGTLVRVPGTMRKSGSGALAWVDASGVVEPLPYERRTYMAPRVAPDDRRLLAGDVEDGARIWLFEPGRGASRRLTEPGLQEFWPIWSPDGRAVLHNSNRHGGPTLDIYRRALDGAGAPERLTDGPGNKQPRSWSAGGDTLVFTVGQEVSGVPEDEQTGFDIWILPLGPEGTPEPWLRTPADESHAAVSPDGRWLAYASGASGRPEVYVRPFPGPGGEVQVSAAGGREPLWAPSGGRLYYRDVTGDSVWSVSYRVEDEGDGGAERLVPERPELLFTGGFVSASAYAGRNWDLAPDGERFLVILEGEEGPETWMERTRIDVILNWLPEMERRLAAAGPGGG